MVYAISLRCLTKPVFANNSYAAIAHKIPSKIAIKMGGATKRTTSNTGIKTTAAITLIFKFMHLQSVGCVYDIPR